MTDMTKAKVYAASLGFVFSEGVCSSLSAPVFPGSILLNMLFFPAFVTCMCISESRVFLIRRPSPQQPAAARGGYMSAPCPT